MLRGVKRECVRVRSRRAVAAAAVVVVVVVVLVVVSVVVVIAAAAVAHERSKVEDTGRARKRGSKTDKIDCEGTGAAVRESE